MDEILLFFHSQAAVRIWMKGKAYFKTGIDIGYFYPGGN